MGAGYNGGTRVATVTAFSPHTGGINVLVVGACSAGSTATLNESTPDGVITGSIQPFGSFAGGIFVASSVTEGSVMTL